MRNLHRYEHPTVNLGFAYQVRRSSSLTCDVSNLFNEPQRLYRGIRNRMSSTIVDGTTITVDVCGRL